MKATRYFTVLSAYNIVLGDDFTVFIHESEAILDLLSTSQLFEIPANRTWKSGRSRVECACTVIDLLSNCNGEFSYESTEGDLVSVFDGVVTYRDCYGSTPKLLHIELAKSVFKTMDLLMAPAIPLEISIEDFAATASHLRSPCFGVDWHAYGILDDDRDNVRKIIDEMIILLLQSPDESKQCKLTSLLEGSGISFDADAISIMVQEAKMRHKFGHGISYTRCRPFDEFGFLDNYSIQNRPPSDLNINGIEREYQLG